MANNRQLNASFCGDENSSFIWAGTSCLQKQGALHSYCVPRAIDLYFFIEQKLEGVEVIIDI